MKRKVQEKVRMYQLVHYTAVEFRSTWENNPKFAEAITILEGKIASLNLAAEKQSAYTLGVTATRDALKQETIDLSIEVGAALIAYSFDKNDLELMAQLCLNRAKFTHASHFNLLVLIDRVVNHADTYSADLVEYGVSAEKLAQLHFKRDALCAGILAPKKAILKRKNQGVLIDSIVSEIDLLFKVKIDSLIRLFEKSSPDFYTAFQNARKVTRVVYHNTPNTDTAPEVDDGPDPF